MGQTHDLFCFALEFRVLVYLKIILFYEMFLRFFAFLVTYCRPPRRHSQCTVHSFHWFEVIFIFSFSDVMCDGLWSPLVAVTDICRNVSCLIRMLKYCLGRGWPALGGGRWCHPKYCNYIAQSSTSPIITLFTGAPNIPRQWSPDQTHWTQV